VARADVELVDAVVAAVGQHVVEHRGEHPESMR
jgi:hypothetical protein